MRALLAVAVLGFSSMALGTNVTIDRPRQGQKVSSSGIVEVAVSVSYDFVPGKDGWVEIWVDANFVTWFREGATSGTVTLAPGSGSHNVQARLVDLYHQPLRVPAVSNIVKVIVPTPDPNGRD
jgi:hypothetical protein